MTKSRIVSLAMGTVLLLSSAASAQQENRVQPTQTGLALEIVRMKGQLPMLASSVPGPDSKPNGSWFSSFGKVPGWQLPDGALPVRAVQVFSRLDGTVVKVWVSVIVGRESHERNEPVTTREIAEGENVVVKELSRFGVEPIEIKVVRVNPRVAILPQIVNKTKSVEVTGISPTNKTLPGYQISLFNSSEKDLVGLQWNILLGGNMGPQGRAGDAEGRTLIPFGGKYELQVSAGYQIQPKDAARPIDFTRAHDFVISAAIFSDGSYEGDPVIAAGMKASLRAQKIQIARVVRLLQAELASPELDARPALRRLKTESAALKTDAEAMDLEALGAEFPGLPPGSLGTLSGALRAGLQGIKRQLIESLEELEKAEGASLNEPALRSWLLTTKERYDQWLARL